MNTRRSSGRRPAWHEPVKSIRPKGEQTVPDTFALSIFVPDKRFLEMEAQEVVVTTPEGRLGVMAGHMPMVVSVVESTVDILQDGHWKTAAVSHGFAEFHGDRADLFVNTAEWAHEIDTARAREALHRAEQRLKNELSRVQYVRTKTAVARALARLKAADTVK